MRTRNAAGWVLVVGCAVVLAATARADIVGVDVSGSVYTGPGVLDATTRTWVSAPTTGNTFTLDGQTVTMTYGTNWAGGIDAPIDLFDNYKHNNGTTTFGTVLTGLDTTKAYNLVVYGAQNFLGGRGGRFTMVEGGNGTQTTTGDQTSSFADGVNYVRFDGLMPDNSLGDQRIRFLTSNGPDGIGIFNGFEIEVTEARAYQEVVNIDFPGNRTQYAGPGVLHDTGTVWNNLTIDPATNLLDSTGNATAVDADLDGPIGNGAIGGSNALTTDYYYDTRDQMTLTFSDLVAGAPYDLALFGAQDGFGGRGSTFTIAGEGSAIATADFDFLNTNGFREGDTHVLFSDVLADASGQIVVSVTQEPGTGIGFINGAQIAKVDVIPEPTTMALGLLGLLLTRCRRWRRRRRERGGQAA
ncbi:hypothetical protein ACFL09_02220 [Planctomycetota bacterium]